MVSGADCPVSFFERNVLGFRLSQRKSRKPDLGVWNPRTVFGEILGNVKFNISGRDLLISMAIRESFPETLKRHYTLAYHEDHLSRSEYLYFKTENLGNTGDEMYYKGRYRLVVLIQNV